MTRGGGAGKETGRWVMCFHCPTASEVAGGALLCRGSMPLIDKIVEGLKGTYFHGLHYMPVLSQVYVFKEHRLRTQPATQPAT